MKTLLILGSNSDVAQACAYRFAKENFNILLATRNVDEYQKRLASDLSIRFNVTVENLYFDALKTELHADFYQSIQIKPDVVISAFGYLGNQNQALIDFTEAHLIISTNYIGNVSILSIVSNDMESKNRGTIIAISSVAGERGRKSNYIYGSSKAALSSYLSGLRVRLAQSNVHVATIIPGFIKSKMIAGLNTPKSITATPEQVAFEIWKAYSKRKNITYVLPVWRFIMFVIKNIPENIFKKMIL